MKDKDPGITWSEPDAINPMVLPFKPGTSGEHHAKNLDEIDWNGLFDQVDGAPTTRGPSLWREETETIDLNCLVSPDLTESGSFDVGAIWTTTFGKLLQALPLITFLVDKSSIIVAANDACNRLSLNYRKRIATPFTDLFPDPEESMEAGRSLLEVFRTRKQPVVKAAISMDSKTIWGRLTMRSISLCGEKLVMVIVEDLTAERRQLLIQQRANEELRNEISRRRTVERELIVSRKRYRQVVETANDIIFTTDSKGRFTWVNPLTLSKTKYSEEELLGRHFLDLIEPGHREQAKERYLRQFFQKIPDTYYEFPIITGEGDILWIGQNVQMLLKSDKVMGFQGIARDITDRKLAEEQLKASLKEKEVLMREIHHRVKNNLQVISALLMLQADRLKDEQSIELLAGANARIRAIALAHEKLYNSGNLAQIRMDEYISDLSADLLGFCAEFRPEIKLAVEIEELYFGPDMVISIGLIITELVENAIRHAFPSARSGTVTVELHRNGENYFELAVSDDGVGLRNDKILEDTKSMGLDLVTALSKKLGGELRVDSRSGTRFSIRFSQTDAPSRS